MLRHDPLRRRPKTNCRILIRPLSLSLSFSSSCLSLSLSLLLQRPSLRVSLSVLSNPLSGWWWSSYRVSTISIVLKPCPRPSKRWTHVVSVEDKSWAVVAIFINTFVVHCSHKFLIKFQILYKDVGKLFSQHSCQSVVEI